MLRKHLVLRDEISELRNINIPINVTKNKENVPQRFVKLFQVP